jgi:acetolactate synthase I/II/III large subunit
LGWVLHGSGPFAAEFHDWDHAAIARAMGCRGVRVEDPEALAPALHEALAAREPAVIDVRTSLKTTFADITSQLAKDASPRRR